MHICMCLYIYAHQFSLNVWVSSIGKQNKFLIFLPIMPVFLCRQYEQALPCAKMTRSYRVPLVQQQTQARKPLWNVQCSSFSSMLCQLSHSFQLFEKEQRKTLLECCISQALNLYLKNKTRYLCQIHHP